MYGHISIYTAIGASANYWLRFSFRYTFLPSTLSIKKLLFVAHMLNECVFVCRMLLEQAVDGTWRSSVCLAWYTENSEVRAWSNLLFYRIDNNKFVKSWAEGRIYGCTFTCTLSKNVFAIKHLLCSLSIKQLSSRL